MNLNYHLNLKSPYENAKIKMLFIEILMLTFLKNLIEKHFLIAETI